MTDLEQKLALHQAASNLTNAFMGGVVDNIAPDQQFKDQAEVNLVFTVCEAHRIFYHWLHKTLYDATWPNPGTSPNPTPPTPVPAPSGVVQAAGQLLAGNTAGVVNQVAQDLLGNLGVAK